MVDAIRLPQSNTPILDADGVPVDGGKIEIFNAGTSDQATVYSDASLTTSAANPIVANGNGFLPVRFVGTASYKVVYQDASGSTLGHYETEDNALGALDTSGFLTGTVAPSRTVISKTSSYTTTAADKGKHINGDPTGGDFTITLFSAVTLGDGGDYLIKHSGTSGILTVEGAGGQTIDGKTSYKLYPRDVIVVRSDGANYVIGEAYRFTDGIVTVTFSTSITIDVSLYPSGVDYQITATDDFTLTTSNDRAGLGYTLTIVQDSTGNRIPTFNTKFKGNATIDLRASAITKIGVFTRTTSDLDYWTLKPLITGVPDVIVEHQQTQNTDGGATTVDASFQDTPLTTQVRYLQSSGRSSADISPASSMECPGKTHQPSWPHGQWDLVCSL